MYNLFINLIIVLLLIFWEVDFFVFLLRYKEKIYKWKYVLLVRYKIKENWWYWREGWFCKY